MTTAQRLRTYIDAELSDAALYRELSNMAPNADFRRLLLEIADDEQAHAERFKQILRDMTGMSYSPVIPVSMIEDSFANVLRDRVLDESGDYRKYGEQYMNTVRNNALKKAYYLTHLDENVHALRLLDMLSASA